MSKNGVDLCYVTKTDSVSHQIEPRIHCGERLEPNHNISELFQCEGFPLDVAGVGFDCLSRLPCGDTENADCQFLCQIHGFDFGTVKSDIQCIGWNMGVVHEYNPTNVTWKGDSVVEDGFYLPLGIYGSNSTPRMEIILIVDPQFVFWTQAKDYVVGIILSVIALILLADMAGV